MARVWGRILANRSPNVSSTTVTADTTVVSADFSSVGLQWVMVQTDPTTGLDDMVYVTALCQALALNLNESPFYADWGIPAIQSVMQQVFPDFYVMLTQIRFAPFFANLQITKQTSPTPTYNVTVTTHAGVVINAQVPVPK